MNIKNFICYLNKNNHYKTAELVLSGGNFSVQLDEHYFIISVYVDNKKVMTNSLQELEKLFCTNQLNHVAFINENHFRDANTSFSFSASSVIPVSASETQKYSTPTLNTALFGDTEALRFTYTALGGFQFWNVLSLGVYELNDNECEDFGVYLNNNYANECIIKYGDFYVNVDNLSLWDLKSGQLFLKRSTNEFCFSSDLGRGYLEYSNAGLLIPNSVEFKSEALFISTTRFLH